VKPLLPAIDAG